MKPKMKDIFINLIVFLSLNITMFGQTLSVKTITEALNYTGNINSVKKLIITDSILGKDYSDTSEWSKIRNLNEKFPNIDTVEIMTTQDIPDSYYPESARVVGLFYDSKIFHLPPNWLKHFSAPNTKKIGRHSFMRCGGLETVNFPKALIIGDLAFQYSTLISADFPNVKTIGGNAFIMCPNLKSINFPLITKIGFAFFDCPMLSTVSFGTGFKEPTKIDFGTNVFGSVTPFPFNKTSTLKIDLILGEYALPKPDLNNKIWQNDNNERIDPVWNDTTYALDYYWKSILIKKSSLNTNDIIKSIKVSIYPNPTNNFLYIKVNHNLKNGTLTVMDMSGKTVLSDEINGNYAEVDIAHLLTGNYILRIEEKNVVIKETKIIKQ